MISSARAATVGSTALRSSEDCDRAADFLKHLQLIDRLREVAGALLHLPFEVGIGLVQVGPAMLLNWLASSSSSSAVFHLDAMAEIAGAKTPRAGAGVR